MSEAPYNWKYAFAQSTYITVVWNWFMILAAKAAEPVLVVSVLYASVKLLPIVHFPQQFDVVIFIAQFMALDIGGLSLNKLADQAMKDGNEEGARQAKRLSIALVAVMLVGVITAGVYQVVQVDGQVGTIIDTILLIARAILAVLYSRVIHSLRSDDEPDVYIKEDIQTLITEATKVALSDTVTQFEANLLQALDERLTMLDIKQADAIARLKAEQTSAVAETTEAITTMVDAALRKRAVRETKAVTVTNVRSISDAPSKKTAAQDIDKVIWPLLHTGMTVRAIAERADTSSATVGRSRKRWEAAQRHVSVDEPETEKMEGLATNA